MRLARHDYAELQCDECHKVICLVYENDLNGTYFCCFDCWHSEKELKGRG
jgi:hypothetical protein